MFPIKAQRPLRITPTVTHVLLVINGLIFLWELTLGANLGATLREIALIPCQSGFNFETLFDSLRTMFLHASWLHVLSNMIFLVVFGPHLEQFLGRIWYIAFYFAAGMAANVAHVITHAGYCDLLGAGTVPVIGASGAIFGLLGGFILLFPATKVQTMVLFLRIPVGFIDMSAFFMLGMMFLVDLVDSVGSLGADTVTTRGVAVWAHVGGFLAGIVMTFLFTAFKKPLPPLDSRDEVHVPIVEG